MSGATRILLRTLSEPERLRLLGKVMREARDTDVWRIESGVARNERGEVVRRDADCSQGAHVSEMPRAQSL
jgi:hypothetical protein